MGSLPEWAASADHCGFQCECELGECGAIAAADDWGEYKLQLFRVHSLEKAKEVMEKRGFRVITL